MYIYILDKQVSSNFSFYADTFPYPVEQQVNVQVECWFLTIEFCKLIYYCNLVMCCGINVQLMCFSMLSIVRLNISMKVRCKWQCDVSAPLPKCTILDHDSSSNEATIECIGHRPSNGHVSHSMYINIYIYKYRNDHDAFTITARSIPFIRCPEWIKTAVTSHHSDEGKATLHTVNYTTRNYVRSMNIFSLRLVSCIGFFEHIFLPCNGNDM